VFADYAEHGVCATHILPDFGTLLGSNHLSGARQQRQELALSRNTASNAKVRPTHPPMARFFVVYCGQVISPPDSLKTVETE